MVLPMEPGRRQRRKDALRATIIAAGIRLIREHGFDAVTMEQIAAAADVAKATLYAYFPCKEAIIGGLLRAENAARAGDLVALMDACPDTRSRLVALFGQVSLWQIEHRPLLERYVPYRLASLTAHNAGSSGFGASLAAVLARGQGEGDVRGDLPVTTLTRTLEASYMWVLLDWLGGDGDLIAACRTMVDLFLDGAGGRP